MHKCLKFYLLEGVGVLQLLGELEGQSSEACGSAGGAGSAGRGREC